MDIDAILAKVGGYKRWNLFMFLIVGISLNIPLCFHSLSIVFVGWEPPHSCAGSESMKNQTNVSQLNHLFLIRLNLTEQNQSQNFDPKCYVEKYDIRTSNVSLMNCDNWTFETDGYRTIVEEWNLVCHVNYMTELSQTIYQLAFITGELVSFVVDRFGRKRLHIISQICICIIGVINASSVSYPMFLLSKAFTGFFVAINLVSGFTLLLEFFDAKRRALPGIMLQIIWTACHVILPGLAFSIRRWRSLQMVLSSASLIAAALLIPIPESPSWLLTKGKTEKAEKILRDIARWNKVELHSNKLVFGIKKPTESTEAKEHDTEICISNIEKTHKNQEDGAVEHKTNKETVCIKPTVVKLRKKSKFGSLLDPVILKYLAISSLLWFSNCFMYYGIILATPSLEGNRFLNFLLMGLIEIPSTLLAFFFTKKFGRRLTCLASLLLAGCFVAVIVFIPRDTTTMTWVSLVFVILSKGFVAISFDIMILYTAELFPTDIRATCCGVCQFCGRLGSLSAPMTAYMAKSERLFWVPNILFGVVSILVSFLLLFLPETNNQPLPETIEDCHKLDENKFFKCQRKR